MTVFAAVGLWQRALRSTGIRLDDDVLNVRNRKPKRLEFGQTDGGDQRVGAGAGIDSFRSIELATVEDEDGVIARPSSDGVCASPWRHDVVTVGGLDGVRTGASDHHAVAALCCDGVGT